MLVARSRLAQDLLEKIGLEPGRMAMIQCRMSALGCVAGGAETVVRALICCNNPRDGF
jgi:aminoglycoside N3'-acetyltransferase